MVCLNLKFYPNRFRNVVILIIEHGYEKEDLIWFHIEMSIQVYVLF